MPSLSTTPKACIAVTTGADQRPPCRNRPPADALPPEREPGRYGGPSCTRPRTMQGRGEWSRCATSDGCFHGGEGRRGEWRHEGSLPCCRRREFLTCKSVWRREALGGGAALGELSPHPVVQRPLPSRSADRAVAASPPRPPTEEFCRRDRWRKGSSRRAPPERRRARPEEARTGPQHTEESRSAMETSRERPALFTQFRIEMRACGARQWRRLREAQAWRWTLMQKSRERSKRRAPAEGLQISNSNRCTGTSEVYLSRKGVK